MSTVFPLSAAEVQRWLFSQFERGTPPFSFVYGSNPSSQLLPRWVLQHSSRRLDRSRTQHLFAYVDGSSGLMVQCECTLFRDYPAVEWVLRFRHGGDRDTPTISEVQAVDTVIAGEGVWKLHRVLGSNAQRNDFAPVVDELTSGKTVHLAPVGGRSSNTHALPFFNLQSDGGGVLFALGWSGQWAADFAAKGRTSLHLRAGMEQTYLTLHPGEQIRSPRVLLLFWQGEDEFAGFNRLRRFLLQYHTPRRGGRPVTLPFAFTSCGPPDEANQTNEREQLDFAAKVAPYGVDYYWLDAGWFEGRWPNGVGNWFPRKDGFPRGLRPLSDGVKRLGMKGLLLWFEPERVFEGTWLDREHPEWLLRLSGNPNRLLDLGNPAAREWLTDHLSQMIEREGIAVYRQDFNIEPLPYWRANDPADRHGITEIRYVEGLYALWDALLQRHPGLLIDNCASGGRRLDLETISRSVALWRSDYNYFEPVGKQCHTAGISRFLPATSTGCGYPDTYLMRSGMNNGIVLWTAWVPGVSYDVYRQFLPPETPWERDQPFPTRHAKALCAEFRRVRGFFFGDFYLLTPYSTAEEAWMAYQFHLADRKAGIVLVFRRKQCPNVQFNLRLRAVEPDALYEVRFSDDNLRRTVKSLQGHALAQGLSVTIDRVPGSLLIEYRKR